MKNPPETDGFYCEGGIYGEKFKKALEQFDINFIKLLRCPFLGTRASQPKANPERVVCVADEVCLRKWTAKQVSEKIYFFRETTARMVENLKNFQLNLL